MASDYGDDAGEKMIDDFMRFAERMGERAMYERAHRIQRAFENATRAARRSAGKEVPGQEEPPEWAKLDMAEFQEIEGYEGIKATIEAELRFRGVESAWFADPGTGKEHLLFRIADAREVWESFDKLGREAGAAADRAAETLRARAPEGREAPHAREAREADGGRPSASRGGKEAGPPALSDDRPLEERAEHARGAAEALEAQRATTKSLERGARPRKARAR